MRFDNVFRLTAARGSSLMQFTPHLAGLGIAIFLGIGIGLVMVLDRPAAVNTADRWTLPQWVPYHTAPNQDLQLLNWTDDPSRQKVAEVPKVVVPPWRFIGTLYEGAKYLAVIEVDQGKRIQKIGRGDKLPNGAEITQVSAGELVYGEDGAQKSLKLFAVEKFANDFGAGKKK